MLAAGTFCNYSSIKKHPDFLLLFYNGISSSLKSLRERLHKKFDNVCVNKQLVSRAQNKKSILNEPILVVHFT
jgi:hypothetical protein